MPDLLPMVGQVHPGPGPVAVGRVAHHREQVRRHAVLIAQRGVVLGAQASQPRGPPSLDHLALDRIVRLDPGVLARRVAQVVVRVGAHQVDDDQLARVWIGQRLAHRRQHHAVGRHAARDRARRLTMRQFVGVAGMHLLDGHVVLVADPPDPVAGGARASASRCRRGVGGGGGARWNRWSSAGSVLASTDQALRSTTTSPPPGASRRASSLGVVARA